MRKNKDFIIINTHINHYEIYEKGVFFSKKIADATVNLQETRVTVYASSEWKEYKEVLGEAIKNAHFLLKKKENEAE